MQQNAKNDAAKQYNLCLECPHIGRKCDGPNFLAMSIEEICEWCRNRRDYIKKYDPKWTHAYIAERTGLSVTSVDRFFAGNITDIKMSTAALIVKALVVLYFDEEAWGEFPCPMVGLADDNPDLKGELDALKEAHNKEKELMRKELAHYRERNEFLVGQIGTKDRHIDELNKRMEERTEFLYQKDERIRSRDKKIKKLYIAVYSMFILLVAATVGIVVLL